LVVVATTTSSTSSWVVVRRVGWVVAALVRLVGVGFLVVSVVWGWRASYARFGVCFGAEKPPVDLPASTESACVHMQGDLYNQVMPEVPWVPITDAARLEGLSLMVLGVGVAVVAVSLVGRWWLWLLSAAAGVGLGAIWVGMGLPVWRTALADGVRVGYEDYMGAVSLTWGTFWVTAGLTVLAWYWGGRDGKVVAAFWAALTLAQPLPEAFITLILWPSHDTSPLHGLFRCVLVGLAALMVLVPFTPPEWRDRWLGRPLRWVGRGVARAVARAAARVQEFDDRLGTRPRW
jgi:hypothetical protein